MYKELVSVIKGKKTISDKELKPFSSLSGEEKAKLSDHALLSYIKSGDREAFSILVKRYEKKILNILYLQLGNIPDLEDLVQEVFIKAFKNINSFRGESKFSTWLYRIAINIAYDYRRKNKEVYSLDNSINEDDDNTFESIIAGDTKDPLDIVEKEDVKSKVRRLMMELPNEYQEVLILREYEGLSYEEIAKILNCPVGTVESRLFRARKELKERLLKEDGNYAM